MTWKDLEQIADNPSKQGGRLIKNEYAQLFAEWVAATACAGTGVPLEPIATGYSNSLKKFEWIQVVKSAATIGAPFAPKRFRRYCLRVEAPDHPCIATVLGTRASTVKP